jgi:hypothetical protein
MHLERRPRRTKKGARRPPYLTALLGRIQFYAELHGRPLNDAQNNEIEKRDFYSSMPSNVLLWAVKNGKCLMYKFVEFHVEKCFF